MARQKKVEPKKSSKAAAAQIAKMAEFFASLDLEGPLEEADSPPPSQSPHFPSSMSAITSHSCMGGKRVPAFNLESSMMSVPSPAMIDTFQNECDVASGALGDAGIDASKALATGDTAGTPSHRLHTSVASGCDGIRKPAAVDEDSLVEVHPTPMQRYAAEGFVARAARGNAGALMRKSYPSEHARELVPVSKSSEVPDIGADDEQLLHLSPPESGLESASDLPLSLKDLPEELLCWIFSFIPLELLCSGPRGVCKDWLYHVSVVLDTYDVLRLEANTNDGVLNAHTNAMMLLSPCSLPAFDEAARLTSICSPQTDGSWEEQDSAPSLHLLLSSLSPQPGFSPLPFATSRGPARSFQRQQADTGLLAAPTILSTSPELTDTNLAREGEAVLAGSGDRRARVGAARADPSVVAGDLPLSAVDGNSNRVRRRLPKTLDRGAYDESGSMVWNGNELHAVKHQGHGQHGNVGARGGRKRRTTRRCSTSEFVAFCAVQSSLYSQVDDFRLELEVPTQ